MLFHLRSRVTDLTDCSVAIQSICKLIQKSRLSVITPNMRLDICFARLMNSYLWRYSAYLRNSVVKYVNSQSLAILTNISTQSVGQNLALC